MNENESNGPEDSGESDYPTGDAVYRPMEDDPEQSVWDSEDAISNLKMERTVHGDETSETLVKRLFNDAAPGAAMSLIHIAMHSQNDNTRMSAAKYITDFVTAADTENGKLKWEDLVGDVVNEAELHANQGS